MYCAPLHDMAKLYDADFNSSALSKFMGNAAFAQKDQLRLSPEGGARTFDTAKQLADFIRLPAAQGGGSKFAPFCVDIFENDLVLVEVNEQACNLFKEPFVYHAQRVHAQRALVVPFAIAEECAELLADESFARTSDIIHLQSSGRSGSTLLAQAMAASMNRVRVIMESDCYLNICGIVHEGALGPQCNPSEWCEEEQSEVVSFLKLKNDRQGYTLQRSYWDFVNSYCRICNIFFLHFCTHDRREKKQIVVLKYRSSCTILSKNLILSSAGKPLPRQHFLWNWRKIVPFVESYIRISHDNSYAKYWLETAFRIDKLRSYMWSRAGGFNSIRLGNMNPRANCGDPFTGDQSGELMWMFLCIWLDATDAACMLQETDKLFPYCIEYEDMVRGGELVIRDIWQRFGIPCESADGYRADAVRAKMNKNSQVGTVMQSSRIVAATPQKKGNPGDDSKAEPAIVQTAPWFGKSEIDRLNWLLKEWNRYGPVKSVDYEFPDSERY